MIRMLGLNKLPIIGTRLSEIEYALKQYLKRVTKI